MGGREFQSKTDWTGKETNPELLEGHRKRRLLEDRMSRLWLSADSGSKVIIRLGERVMSRKNKGYIEPAGGKSGKGGAISSHIAIVDN